MPFYAVHGTYRNHLLSIARDGLGDHRRDVHLQDPEPGVEQTFQIKGKEEHATTILAELGDRGGDQPPVQPPHSFGGKSGSGKATAFLVCHGSFNPVHKHHVKIMVESRKALETAGYNVVAGILAPTHRSHLGRKRVEAVADLHRFAGLRLACAEADGPSGWLRCDPRGVWCWSSENMIEQLLEREFQI